MAECTRRMFDELDPLARKGFSRSVRDRFPVFDRCHHCNGTGWRDLQPCSRCGGKGRKRGRHG